MSIYFSIQLIINVWSLNSLVVFKLTDFNVLQFIKTEWYKILILPSHENNYWLICMYLYGTPIQMTKKDLEWYILKVTIQHSPSKYTKKKKKHLRRYTLKMTSLKPDKLSRVWFIIVCKNINRALSWPLNWPLIKNSQTSLLEMQFNTSDLDAVLSCKHSFSIGTRSPLGSSQAAILLSALLPSWHS